MQNHWIECGGIPRQEPPGLTYDEAVALGLVIPREERPTVIDSEEVDDA